VSAYVQEHRERFGVEPICNALGVSASAYYQRASGKRSARQLEDERLLAKIRETHKKNYEAYGYRRTWKVLLRAGEQAPRCQIQRLMREHGIRGAKRRGKPWRTTTLTRTLPGVRTSLIGTSLPGVRTSCGSLTSPTCAAGRGPCSSAS
jgi:putative transposase